MELSARERNQAILVATHEGRRAAQWYLGKPIAEHAGGGPLRGTRWAQARPEFDRLDDRTLHLYAGAETVANEADYVTHVVQRHCPQQAERWWASGHEARLVDPRVCGFCDGYERERCRILGLPAPPTRIADLRASLGEARKRERQSGRAWLASTERSDEPADDETLMKQTIRRWEYCRCVLCTNLARMLLDAALYRRSRDRAQGTLFRTASGTSRLPTG